MSVRDRLRDVRYALPQKIERLAAGPGAAATARRCEALRRRGIATTVGYFQSAGATPDEIVAANLILLSRWKPGSGGDYLSVKAPPLHFDLKLMDRLAIAAGSSGIPLLFDAHSPKDANATLAAVARLLDGQVAAGFALPARWRRSPGDSARFRESEARIRIVKGEWPDEGFSQDIDEAYLELAGQLAGRKAPVAVATHDPVLAQRALNILIDSGTPCELEQLRGLPRRRTVAVARELGVPIRLYVPFGPGWWPYAFDKALGRPYLLSWMLKDWWSGRAHGDVGVQEAAAPALRAARE